ncbi:MAG: hypothetical protein ACM3O4_04130 [Ignavibacteriales bacterium]
MKKYIIVSVLTLLMIVILGILFVNNRFDIIKEEAIKSFDKLLTSKNLNVVRNNSSLLIRMPDNTTKVIFDTNSNTNVSIYLDAKPFLDNGLEITKLPSYIFYEQDTNELILSVNYGDRTNLSFEDIIETYRDKLDYHNKLGHFGLAIKDGNGFEYAKNMVTNDKDVVIVLNPEVFIKAGVDVNNLDDYKYIDVEMDNGQKVKKLVKVFDLEE